jgi:hypothetical protein
MSEKDKSTVSLEYYLVKFKASDDAKRICLHGRGLPTKTKDGTYIRL